MSGKRQKRKGEKKDIEEEDEEIQIVHAKIVSGGAAARDEPPPLSSPRPSPPSDEALIASMKEQVAALTAAATPRPTLPVDAPPGLRDKDFWSGRPLGVGCPRCGKDLGNVPATRSLHYRTHHYTTYFPLVHHPDWTPLQRFVHVNFGSAKGQRSCVRCVRKEGQSSLHRGRLNLIQHLHVWHYDEFIELARDYRTHNRWIVPDSIVHEFMMNPPPPAPPPPKVEPPPSPAESEAARAAQAAADAAAIAAAVAAPARKRAAPALALDEPRSAVDEEYWNGNASMTICPRGCYYLGNCQDSRRGHYKRHHYNIYYSMTYQWATEQWIFVQFGDKNAGARVCVHCEGERRHWSDYGNRVELARHIQMAHPSTYAHLTQQYGRMFDGQIHDLKIHTMMIGGFS